MAKSQAPPQNRTQAEKLLEATRKILPNKRVEGIVQIIVADGGDDMEEVGVVSNYDATTIYTLLKVAQNITLEAIEGQILPSIEENGAVRKYMLSTALAEWQPNKKRKPS